MSENKKDQQSSGEQFEVSFDEATKAEKTSAEKEVEENRKEKPYCSCDTCA